MPSAPVAYDWPAVRHRYVTAEPAISLRQLSAETGVPFSSIGKHSSAENWPVERQRFWDTVATETRALAVKETACQRVGSLEGVETAIDVLSRQLRSMGDALAGQDWSDADPDSISKASASVATALDKVARCKELLTGGADSRSQVALASVIAELG